MFYCGLLTVEELLVNALYFSCVRQYVFGCDASRYDCIFCGDFHLSCIVLTVRIENANAKWEGG